MSNYHEQVKDVKKRVPSTQGTDCLPEWEVPYILKIRNTQDLGNDW